MRGTLLGSMAFEGPPHRTPVVGGTREAADQPRYMSAEWLAQRQPLDQAYLACAESSPREGVPRGRVKSHHGWAPAGGSSAYPETRRELYIYTPPGIDAAQVRAGTQPAPHLILFQDGPGYLQVQDGGGMNVPTVLDNMLADGEIEPTVGVFLSPGVPNAISDEDQALTGVDPQTLGEDERPAWAAAMKRIEQWASDSPYGGQRSFEYDSVTPKFVDFLTDEVLPFVEDYCGYPLDPDPHHRTICGMSSGGICAFNAAWWRPDVFGNVISHCGSFTDLQPLRRPDGATGTFGTESPFHGQPSGAMFPFMVRQSPRKDIRVWMQSGEGDLALPPGNWPM